MRANVTTYALPTRAVICPVGTFGADGTATSSTCDGPCTGGAGTYCPAGSTAASGTACLAGSSCAGAGVAPIVCSPGFACAPGASVPQPCAFNTYAGSGAATCQVCAPGTYAAGNTDVGDVPTVVAHVVGCSALAGTDQAAMLQVQVSWTWGQQPVALAMVRAVVDTAAAVERTVIK